MHDEAAARHFICLTKARPAVIDFERVNHKSHFGAKWDGFARAVSKFGLSTYGTIFFDNRWRRSDGLTPNTGVITLGVHFMGGTEEDKGLIRKTAVEWVATDLRKRIAFKFDVPADQSQIRIGFETEGDNKGAWSLPGRHDEPFDRSTMNLDPANRRTILHEFGHALGLEHEHQHPAAGIVWNEEVVIADMAPYWKPEAVREHIFKRYDKTAACLGDKKFNGNSVMIYEIPITWTTNGFSSPLIEKISRRDIKCLNGIYSVP